MKSQKFPPGSVWSDDPKDKEEFRRRHPMRAQLAADPIARALSRMAKEDDIEVFAPKILKLMKGVSWEIFQVLDEKPGYWGYMGDRFYMLRQVRNHPVYGKQMFEGLRKQQAPKRNPLFTDYP